MRPFMRQFAYASCTLFGRERVGVLFRAANDAAVAPEILAHIEALFCIEDAPASQVSGQVLQQVLRYDDVRRQRFRHLKLEGDKLVAVALGGDISAFSAETWLRSYLETGQSVSDMGRLLLMPSDKAPVQIASRGRIVCNCLNVAESEITAFLKNTQITTEQRFSTLQQQLKCGTSCGSCLPELKRMVLDW